MRLELPVRWTETDSEAERLNELTNDLTKNRQANKPKYTYGKLSIDSDDIGPYYDIDDSHTIINDRLGKVYVVTVPFHEFKKIFTEVSGRAILAIQTNEEYKASRPPRRKKDDNGVDDILNG